MESLILIYLFTSLNRKFGVLETIYDGEGMLLEFLFTLFYICRFALCIADELLFMWVAFEVFDHFWVFLSWVMGMSLVMFIK